VTTQPFDAPSSSIVSTASDLGPYLAFLVAPEKQRLKHPPLGPVAVHRLLEPSEPGIQYGYGWYLEGKGEARTASLDGSLEGFSSRLVLWPGLDAGVAVVAAQNSLMQSSFSMPALVEGARRIMFEGSVARPFPLGRLYILMAVMATVHLVVLALQTGGAIGWAKDVHGRVEARGSKGPLVFALVHSWFGVGLCVAVAFFAPDVVSFCLKRTVSWQSAFTFEPGLAAWCASACFFGLLRNVARIAWLSGSSFIAKFPRKMGA
jgi:hypothetical protein